MTLLEESLLRFDALGRKVPRRLPISTWLAAMGPSLEGRMRQVPRAAIVEDGADEDGPFAMVRCPCGGRPIVRYSFDKCSGCERYYVYCAPIVFVIYGDMQPPVQHVAASPTEETSS